MFSLLRRPDSVHGIQISRKSESQHFLVCGATGTGKTTALRDMMYYAKSCGDVCVVHDPKREFLAEFYDEQRGDVIMDPTDDRCPYWSISDEVTDLADAISTTRGIYPSHPNNPHAQFWDDSACEISAHLVCEYRPNCEEYGLWLRDESEIDRRIKGTEHAQTLTKNSPNMRAGILATMNKAGRPLRMMPTLKEARKKIVLREWVKERKGWIFLPNKQDTREALRPLQSMWLDMLMLRTMSFGRQPKMKRIWFFLDELASLNTLPQLHSGMTEMRFTGSPIVLGIQNIASLEELYGKLAETICSQATTWLLLATSGKAGGDFERMIGDQEIMRMEESYSYDGGRTRRTFSFRESRKPAILGSEIAGLVDLQAILVQRGKVVRFDMPFTPQVFHNNPHIPREIPRLEPLRPTEIAGDASTAQGNEEPIFPELQKTLEVLAKAAGVPLPAVFQAEPNPEATQPEEAHNLASVQRDLEALAASAVGGDVA